MLNNKSQVWIETVIYTLIALSIIGIVLGIIKPALDEQKDKVSIRQSIDVLNEIDNRINDVKYVAGNSRSIDIKITRGKLIIDGENEQVKMIIEDSKYAPSEPGILISEGNIIENTTEGRGKLYTISLTLNYKEKLDISYDGKSEAKTIQIAPTPYRISIVNKGGEIYNIDFSQV